MDFTELKVTVRSIREEKYQLSWDYEHDCDVGDVDGEWLASCHPNNNALFESWMSAHMKQTTTWSQKFNSGNPIFLVWFGDKADAMLFKLVWDQT